MLFDFIWHLRGSARLDSMTSDAAALDGVERLLDDQGKPGWFRNQDDVTFDDPLWSNPFGPNWHAMVIYDRGRFWIERGFDGRILRYELRSLHGFVFCLFAALMAFWFGAADGGGTSEGIKFAAIAFGWLYGMNILLALLRVPPKIRRAARGS